MSFFGAIRSTGREEGFRFSSGIFCSWRRSWRGRWRLSGGERGNWTAGFEVGEEGVLVELFG